MGDEQLRTVHIEGVGPVTFRILSSEELGELRRKAELMVAPSATTGQAFIAQVLSAAVVEPRYSDDELRAAFGDRPDALVELSNQIVDASLEAAD